MPAPFDHLNAFCIVAVSVVPEAPGIRLSGIRSDADTVRSLKKSDGRIQKSKLGVGSWQRARQMAGAEAQAAASSALFRPRSLHSGQRPRRTCCHGMMLNWYWPPWYSPSA